MSKYIKYPSYRDSGVEWLGDLPFTWKKLPIKYIGNLNAGAGFPHSEQGKEGNELPFYKVNALAKSDINDYLTNKENTVSIATARQLGAFIFPVNSIVFAKVGAALLLSRIRWVKYRLCLDNNMMGLIVNDKNFTRFIKYAMNTIKFDYLVNPGAIPSLNESQIGNFYLAIPPLQEQQTIVNYLDTATAKIDTLIEKQTKLIALLKEKRQAVISTAVTRGLDNTVAMKDSGVEWLEEIPEHWHMSKLKYDSYIKARVGWHGLTSDELFEDGDAYAVTGSDFAGNTINWSDCRKCTLERYKEDKFIQLQDDDLLVTKDGTIGKIIKVNKLPDIATLNGGIFVIRPLKLKYNTSYYYWLLISTVFKAFVSYYKTGSTISHLYQDTFCQMPYALPSLEEQQSIVNYLDNKTSKIDNLISKSIKAIDLLKERRTALISAVVTGKIDVREEK